MMSRLNSFQLILFTILFLFLGVCEAQNIRIVDKFKDFANYYSKGDFINAENCLLDVEKQKEQLNTEFLIALYNNLGVINNLLGRYEEALRYLNLAESVIRVDNLISLELADIYINKARIYGMIKESVKAIEYLEQGINIYSSQKRSDKSIFFRLSTAYLNLGLTCFEIENYKLALLYLEKSYVLKQNNDLADKALVLLNIAKIYAKIEKKNKAEEYFSSSIRSFINEFGEDYYRLVDVYFDYGLFLRSNGNKLESFDVHQKALRICLKNFGGKHPFISLAYKLIGDHFFLQSDYETALKYYQSSLIAVVSDFSDTDIYSNPSLGSVLFDIRLLDNLKQKAKALQLFSQQQSDQTEKQRLMTKSFETIELAIQLIERIRNGYVSTESRIYLAENEKETYFFAVKIAKELFELTQKQEYLHSMYSICCRSKSAVLRNEIKENELMKGNSIGDSIRDKRDRLSINIASYSKLIQDELQRKKADSLKLDLWKTTLFNLNREKDEVNKQFKNLFPQYDLILQKTEPTSLKQIQSSLDKEVTLVEYFLSNQYSHGKRQTIIFTITKNQINYSSICLDSVYSSQIGIFKLGTVNNSVPINQSYVDALYYMYDKLIKPIEKDICGKRIIVAPDEDLAYLPFEAFITEKANINQVGFDGLKYLIYDYTFSYIYTSSLIVKRTNNRSSNKVFAFSPSYAKSTLGSAESYQPLFGAGQEIQSIFKWFKGNIYKGEKATESAFKNLTKQPAIYHLAMHSKADSNNSKYSYFIFDNQQDTIDDGKLFNYEVGTSMIESPMVVLSACSTGAGNLYHGEGVMSLARGFIMAGASSVISTFWDVNDDSSAKIITDFYHHLSKGVAKDEALRLAKLNYLRTTPPTYTKPTYWAAYELIGDNSPIKSNRGNLIYFGVFALIGAVSFYFIRSKRS